MKSFLLPLIYFSISLFSSLGLIMICHNVMARMMKKLTGLTTTTLSFNILASGLLISIGLLMSEASRPIVTTISYLSRDNGNSWIWLTAGYIMLFFILVTIFAFIVIFGSLWFFNRMTGDVDEKAELSKGNTGIALLLSVLMISMTLFLKSPIISLMEVIVPIPKLIL
jgi:heme/copper-type cytochrome/quinol oxidase subunit 2